MHRSLSAVLAADIVGYSRHMNEDAAGTLAMLKRMRAEIMEPSVTDWRGQLVKSMGDGWIVTFDSVTNAVECAMQIQDKLKVDGTLALRTGIHIGDVTEDGDDIFGEGVNIAARLQETAEPGAVAVSDTVFSLLDGRLRSAFSDSGERQLKNIPRPVRIWACGTEKDETSPGSVAYNNNLQSIKFASADDGTSLAYCTHGTGPGLVRVGHFPSHLELDWQETSQRAVFDELARSHTLVRFDQRGTGLSDVEIDGVDYDQNAEDMLAVADAAGLDRFVAFGTSGSGAATAVKLAVRHPDRVSKLIVLGGCVDGRTRRIANGQDARSEPIEAMIAEGWDTQDSPFLMAHLLLYFPKIGETKARELARLVQKSCPKRSAIIYRAAMNTLSLAGELEGVQVPTLILHASGDSVHPIAEGRKLASGIPGAEMVVLESGNHYPLSDEPCWSDFCNALHRFLDRDVATHSTRSTSRT